MLDSFARFSSTRGPWGKKREFEAPYLQPKELPQKNMGEKESAGP